MRPIRICELTPGCENPCEGSTNGCASCNHEARKAERFAKKTKVIRAVTKVTQKRATQLQEYYALKAEYLEANPCCSIEGCYLKAVDVHHEGGRENDKLLDVKRFRGLCRKHHTYYTEHSKEAKEDGVSASRTSSNQSK
jgi:hypothetical protein